MQRRVFSIAVAVLGLVALACTCSLPKLGGGPVPSATVAVSQEAANRMKKKLDQASAQVKSGGQFKLTLTESEITSYVVQELANRKTEVSRSLSPTRKSSSRKTRYGSTARF